MTTATFGPLSGTVILDATGQGAIRFAPAGESWDVNNVSVIATTHVLEATATIYKGQIGALYRHSGTYSGSSGDNNQMETPLHLNDGEAMYVVWTGGDVGATATATVSGVKTVNNGGFRVH